MSRSGLPIFAYEFINEEKRDPLLFSGLLKAIKTFLVEVNVGELKSFTTKTTEVYVEVLSQLNEDDDYYALALLKDIEDGISEDEIKILVTNLSKYLDKIKDIAIQGEALNRLNLEINEIMSCWEKDIKQDKTVKKLKEGLW